MSTSALKIPLVEHAPSRILKHAEVGLDFQSLMSAWGAACCAGDVNRNTVVMGGLGKPCMRRQRFGARGGRGSRGGPVGRL